MARSLTPQFGDGDIKRKIDNFILSAEDKIIFRLRRIGEQFVNHARDLDTYSDRTGNLRSSIGYVIVGDGEIMEEFFPGDKPDGRANGAKVAREVAAKYNKGLVLICVAGMLYAAAVESKGYDVITGTVPMAARLFKQLIKNVQS